MIIGVAILGAAVYEGPTANQPAEIAAVVLICVAGLGLMATSIVAFKIFRSRMMDMH